MRSIGFCLLACAALLLSVPPQAWAVVTREMFSPGSIPALQEGELMAIVQSGSTNTRGYTAIVHADGSITLDPPVPEADSPKLSAGAVDAGALKAVLAQIGDVSRIETGRCAKSVSFGTTTRIVYDGKISDDLQCPQDQPPAEVVKLRQMLADIQSRLPVSALRRPMRALPVPAP